MKNLVLILLATAMVFSCNTQRKAEEKPMMDQVMDAHDEVMPKMGELMKTRKALLARAEEMTDSIAAASLIELADNIEAANESMMDWMRNFDPNFEGTEEEVKAYLMKKKESIEKVAEMMNSSVEEGKKALE